MSRTWAVSRDAMVLTASVTSRQLPDRPVTLARPPSRPSVPTSRATRVTSPVNSDSWSTILFTARPRRRRSPRNCRLPSCRSTRWVRSPPATASSTRVALAAGATRASSNWFTSLTREVQAPWPGLAERRSSSRPCRTNSRFTRCTSVLKCVLRSMIWLKTAVSSATRPWPDSGTLERSPSRAAVIAASRGRRSDARIRPSFCPSSSTRVALFSLMAAHFGNSALMGVASLSLWRHRLRRIRPNRSGSCRWGPFRRNGRPLPVPLMRLRTRARPRAPRRVRPRTCPRAPRRTSLCPAAPTRRAPPARCYAGRSPSGPNAACPAPHTSPTGRPATPWSSSASWSPTPSCTPAPTSSWTAGWSRRPAPSSWRSWTTTPRAPHVTAQPKRRTSRRTTDVVSGWSRPSPSPGASPTAPAPRRSGRGCPRRASRPPTPASRTPEGAGCGWPGYSPRSRDAPSRTGTGSTAAPSPSWPRPPTCSPDSSTRTWWRRSPGS